VRSKLPRLQVHVARRTRRGWTPAVRDFQRWAAAALGRLGRDCEISVLLVGPAASRSLNVRYRGSDTPTNVLSFPAMTLAVPDERVLGDLVICPAVLRHEAQAQRKSVRAHWAHLVVHGVLHLIGFDHEHDGDARRMEQREIRVLRRLGVANPYRSG